MLRFTKKQTIKRLTATIVMLVVLNLFSHSEGIRTLLIQINHKLSSGLLDFLYKNFTPEHSVFIASILIGSTEQKLSWNIYSLFKKFNLVHVISISGSNFTLIQSLLGGLKKMINKKVLILILIFIQTLYYITIGFNNAPALRAFIFALISNYSSLIGRPIKFYRKILFTILIILSIKHELLFTLSFALSASFAIFYHQLGKDPLNKIFNNELKRIALIFIVTSFIFSAESPDFLANIIFSFVYPFIFISIFVGYSLNLVNIDLHLIININLKIIEFLFNYFKELTSETNTLIQIIIFLAILITTIISFFNKPNNAIPNHS